MRADERVSRASDGDAVRAEAPRPPDPVHVRVGILRGIKVDDACDAGYVESPGGKVGRDEDGRRGLALERCERRVALALELVSMQRYCERGCRCGAWGGGDVGRKLSSCIVEVRRELLRRRLPADEHDDLALAQEGWERRDEGAPLRCVR